jgi:hypothetical protein
VHREILRINRTNFYTVLVTFIFIVKCGKKVQGKGTEILTYNFEVISNISGCSGTSESVVEYV